MAKEYSVTGLDIGSSKISAVTARRATGGGLEITGQASLPSKGVSKGGFSNIGDATDSVSRVMEKLRQKASRAPGDIYVNISGPLVKGARSVGMIPIALRGREISATDIERCATAAGTIHLPFDREIIHRIVHRFSADDQPWIKDPAGLYASRLSCEAYIITADTNQIQNIYKCVNNAGFDIKELVFTGIADGESLLDNEARDAGAAVADLGGSLVVTAVFSGGSLAEFDVYQHGGDIAAIASRIAARTQESVRAGGRVSYVALTGGMAFADGLVEALEGKVSCPIKIGAVKEIRGDISSVDSIRLATAIGLAKYGCRKHEEKLAAGRNTAHRLSNRIVDIFNRYF
jgi:cell division protein FtsA